MTKLLAHIAYSIDYFCINLATGTYTNEQRMGKVGWRLKNTMMKEEGGSNKYRITMSIYYKLIQSM